MNREMPENTVMQPTVDKVQGVVGGFVRKTFVNLEPSDLGGEVNDNC